MYQYNNPSNDNNNPPLPSARLPARPRFNGQGEEYSMQQTSYNSKPASPGFQSPPPRNDNDLGYYESAIPGSNNMQRPLMAGNVSSISTATTLGGNGGGGGGGGGGGNGGTRFGSPTSNMVGGGPGDFGIAPRRQTRRYKTGKKKKIRR